MAQGQAGFDPGVEGLRRRQRRYIGDIRRVSGIKIPHPMQRQAGFHHQAAVDGMADGHCRAKHQAAERNRLLGNDIVETVDIRLLRFPEKQAPDHRADGKFSQRELTGQA